MIEASKLKKKKEEIEAYKKLSDFKCACRETIKSKSIDMVRVANDASTDARLIFSIKTKLELLSVILNFNKDELNFVNTTTKKNTKEKPPPIIYAFYFSYNSIDGYLAFYISSYTSKWEIKSFHHKYKVEETAMAEAFRIAGIKINKEKS